MVAVAVAASASASAAAVAAYVTFSHLSHTNSFLCHTQTQHAHTQRTHSITNSVVDARETNKKNGKAKTVTKFHTSKVFFMNMRVALPANNCSQVVVVTVVDIALTVVVVVARVVAVTVADQWSM